VSQSNYEKIKRYYEAQDADGLMLLSTDALLFGFHWMASARKGEKELIDAVAKALSDRSKYRLG
jgi:hypothetical protein